MPLTRYRIKNEYGLADPETYRSADKDDPEALLEGVAMAGLVGLLRQLGDLAEFAAEIFHDLHEEVMATAARGHGLMVRIQQLEAEFPPIEKALLLQTNHSLYYSNAGVEWHPNLQMEQNLVARGDLPRFVMDSYEESRGPPRLFLLDKFDVAGAGACLKRYTDPSFFKVETSPGSLSTMDGYRERKVRKTKKKGARWRNGETPETVPASHAKLHQLFMEERIENAYNDPARRVKLKRRPLNGSPFDSKSGKSYMEKFVESPSPESKTICEVSVAPLSLKWTQDDTSESALEIVEVSAISPVKDVSQANGRDVSSPNVHGKQFMDDVEDCEPTINGERDEVSSTFHAAVEEKELMFNGDGNREGSIDGYHSDEVTSELENYLDALATIESEVETDNDSRSRLDTTLLDTAKGVADCGAHENMELPTETLGSQSVGSSASDDGNSSFSRSSSSLCTDGPSNLGDGAQSDGDRFPKLSPPCENAITDSGSLPVDQLPHSKEACEIETRELTVFTDKGIESDAVCDVREASQTLSSSHFELAYRPRHAGSRSSVGSEEDDISSGHIKHAAGLSDSDDDTMADLVESPALASDDVPNQSDGDNLDTVATKCFPMDELETGHLNVCSMDMEPSSDNLAMTSECDSRNGVSNTGDVAESCNEIFSRRDSPQSILSLEEQHHMSPCAGEDGSADRTFSSALLPPDSDDEHASSAGDEVNYAIPAPVADLEKSTVSEGEQQAYVEDQRFSDEAVTEGNSSDLGFPYKGGDQVISRTLSSESIDSLTNYMEAGGGEPGDHIHPGIPYAGIDIGSNADDPLLKRVSLDDTSATIDEARVLVEDQQSLGETEKATLLEGDLSQMDIQNVERNGKEVPQDGESMDSPPCDLDAVGGVTVSLVPPGDDDSVSDGSATPEVQAEGVGNCLASVADMGVEAQGRVESYETESPSWMEESGMEEKLNEVEVAPADLDSVSAADWDSMARSYDSTGLGVSGSSLSEQTQSGVSCDIGTTLIESELGNAEHALLRTENDVSSQGGLTVSSTAVPEESSKLLDDEPADDLHLAYDDISESQNLQARQVLSPELLDQKTVFLHKPEDNPEYDLKLQEEAHHRKLQQVSGATQLPGCENELQTQDNLSLEKEEGSSVELHKNITDQQPSPMESLQGPMLDTGLHNFGLLSEGGKVDLLDMPPLPPLPPVQWRMGKPHNVSSTQDRKFPGFSLGLLPPLQPSLPDENPQIEFPAFETGTPFSHNPFLMGPPPSHNPFLSPMHFETENPAQSYPYALEMPPMNSDSGARSNAVEVKPLPGSLWPEPILHEPTEQYSPAFGENLMQGSSLPQSVGEDITSHQRPGSPPLEELPRPVDESVLETDKEVQDLQQKTENEDGEEDSPTRTDSRQEPENQLGSKEERVGSTDLNQLDSMEESARSTDQWALPPTNEGGKPNGTMIGNVPHPPKPLIEAVAAHDRSKLRKVADRVRPQLAPQPDERDSLLEQIRAKSFNLKPAAATRPSMQQQGPKTNLRVAAILLKASAIRQAMTGSDEDDDADSWSE